MVCFARNESDDRYDPRWCIREVIDSSIESGDMHTLRLLYDQLGHERRRIAGILGDDPPGTDISLSSGETFCMVVLPVVALTMFVVAAWEFFFGV